MSLRLLTPKTPKDLETICLKCLQKETHRRYASAAELADDLNRYLEGRPVLARPVSLTTMTWRWTRRNPWIATPTAVSLLLLVGGTMVSSYFGILAQRRADAEYQHRIRADRETHSANDARARLQVALAQEKAARELAEVALQESRWNAYKMSLYPMLDTWREQQFGLLETGAFGQIAASRDG